LVVVVVVEAHEVVVEVVLFQKLRH
jgi:hypothetical protein